MCPKFLNNSKTIFKAFFQYFDEFWVRDENFEKKIYWNFGRKFVEILTRKIFCEILEKWVKFMKILEKNYENIWMPLF